MFVELDKCIQKSDYYIGIKENMINKLSRSLKSCPTNKSLQLKYNAALFEEYKSYKYDSAYYFAVKSLDLAREMSDPYQIIDAKIRLLFCYLSSGLFKESFDLVSGINVSQSDNAQKLRYYKVMARLYYDLADYNAVEPFKSQYDNFGLIYSDSIISLLPQNGFEKMNALGLQKMKKKDYIGSIEEFQKALAITTDNHEYAIAASSLGYLNTLTNQYDEAAINITKAAIADIKSSTKETVALRLLATQLYQRKIDIDRAYKYIKIALDDAVFYNARHRKIEIGSILPIIEKERIYAVEKQRNLLLWLVSSVSLLFILLLMATLVINRQLKKIKTARLTIQEQNEKLQLVNTELKEISNIKDKYIGHFFYVNYQHLDKLERIYRSINRKLAVKQYDDLAKSFKESELENDRKEMYNSFDETFLTIFPDFVHEYKQLFPVDEIETMHLDGKNLTLEMRIFALIRLGVYESEKIAKFLNYSVNTINTYKSKVKNKSWVQNELFEQKIMEIKYEKSNS
jgi:tetratricopeptide (TPR) repeat protein